MAFLKTPNCYNCLKTLQIFLIKRLAKDFVFFETFITVPPTNTVPPYLNKVIATKYQMFKKVRKICIVNEIFFELKKLAHEVPVKMFPTTSKI